MADKEGTARLRQIKYLTREAEIIRHACGDKRQKQSAKGRDEFQQAKAELAGLLHSVKDDIRTHRGMVERMGRSQDEIRLKHEIGKNLDLAKAAHGRLEEAYAADAQRGADGKKMTAEELKAREELVRLLKQDLDFTVHEFGGSGSAAQGGRSFQIARQARDRRRKQRELQGGNAAQAQAPQPLSEEQQRFLDETLERDEQMDAKLDLIKKGVVELGEIGADVNAELEKQAHMLNEVEEEMDKVGAKLQSRNQQVKELLEATGGAQRWCPVLVLLVVLLALLGYIYDMATN